MILNEADRDGLNRAAALLAAVGFLDAIPGTDPTVSIYALAAVEELRRAGADPLAIRVADTREAIAEAIRLLGSLSDSVFSLELVANAVDSAQDAYAATKW